MTPERRAELDAEDEARRKVEYAQDRTKRELAKSERDLQRLQRRKLEPESVSAKIAESLARKIERLKGELSHDA